MTTLELHLSEKFTALINKTSFTSYILGLICPPAIYKVYAREFECLSQLIRI